jgi:hypothetical protein
MSIKWLRARCGYYEELYVPDDVLEESNVASCQMSKIIKITLSERIGKIYEWVKTSERKTMSESEVNEREVNERESFTHCYTTRTDSLSSEQKPKRQQAPAECCQE